MRLHRLPPPTFVFKIQSPQAGHTMTKWQQMLVLQRAGHFPLIIQHHGEIGQTCLIRALSLDFKVYQELHEREELEEKAAPPPRKKKKKKPDPRHSPIHPNYTNQPR